MLHLLGDIGPVVVSLMHSYALLASLVSVGEYPDTTV